MQKKIIFSLTLFLLFNNLFSQVDTNKIIHDSIIVHKNYYIGKPLNILFKAMKAKPLFSKPDNMGRRKYGKAFYKNFMIFFPIKKGYPLFDFQIVIAAKVEVDLEDRLKYMYEEEQADWDARVKQLLKKAILVDIK